MHRRSWLEAMLKELCSLLVNEWGLDFDDVAFLPYELVSVGSRFFEEIAEIRRFEGCGRRWLKRPSEVLLSAHIGPHIGLRTMTYQQPLNNIARCAIQTRWSHRGRHP